MHTFILLMASNCNASNHLSEAMERLKLHFPTAIRFSRVHESEAFGKTPAASSPSSVISSPTTTYLNAVCSGKTTRSQTEMEQWLKETETNMGRIHGESAHGRVHIDLDLVVWDGTILRPVDAGRPYYQTCLNDLL
jgi:2-amino-4-hydroxy-6-hydroxymethyldihydropteridine diphosphokinase